MIRGPAIALSDLGLDALRQVRAQIGERVPRATHEENLHIATVKWLRSVLPADIIFWHTPNGGFRHKRAAGRLRAMGARPGVYDLAFASPRWGAKVIWIEMKSAEGRLTEHQREFRDFMTLCGHVCSEARSIEDVAKLLNAVGVPLRASVETP